jgi:ADP-ribosylglycohydrolase
MLLGAARGQYDRYIRYITLSLREWAKSQQFRGAGEKTFCWLPQIPQLRRRLCMDTRITDALRRETLGTPEKPVFRSDTPGILTVAVAVGILFNPDRQTPESMRRLAMEAVALTHGDKLTFLSGAFIASAVATLLHAPQIPLAKHFAGACDRLENQFLNTFPEVEQLTGLIRYAMELSKDPELSPLASMTMLGCQTGAQCTAGAVYASMIHPANFDEGMIAAVNHSGYSAATGALTGAFLGAKLGADALPEFYLESLEAAPWLRELAHDLVQQRQSLVVFDDTWDQKYVQGLPPQI